MGGAGRWRPDHGENAINPAREGRGLTSEEEEAIRAPILEKYEREGSPYYSTARLWDDGILDPAETRQALALGLSAAFNAPISRGRFGVFGCERPMSTLKISTAGPVVTVSLNRPEARNAFDEHLVAELAAWATAPLPPGARGRAARRRESVFGRCRSDLDVEDGDLLARGERARCAGGVGDVHRPRRAAGAARRPRPRRGARVGAPGSRRCATSWSPPTTPFSDSPKRSWEYFLR